MKEIKITVDEDMHELLDIIAKRKKQILMSSCMT